TNHRRPHQSLPANTRPQMPWDFINHAKPQAPLDPAVLPHKASKYSTRRAEMAQKLRLAETPPRPKRLASPPPAADTEVIDHYPHRQVVNVTATNRAVFFQGWKIGLPTNYADRQLYRTVTGDQLAYWCVVEGDMVVSIPLPTVAITGSKKFVNSYNVQGVWLQNQPPLWAKSREQALQKFQGIAHKGSPGRSVW